MYNMSDEHEGRKHHFNLGDEVVVLPTADGTLELGLYLYWKMYYTFITPHSTSNFFSGEPLFPQKCLTPCRPGCCWYSSCYPKLSLPDTELGVSEGRGEWWQVSRLLAMSMSQPFVQLIWVLLISWLSNLWANKYIRFIVKSYLSWVFLLLATDPLLTAEKSRWRVACAKAHRVENITGLEILYWEIRPECGPVPAPQRPWLPC